MLNRPTTTEIAPWLVVVADPGWLYAQTVPLPDPDGGVGLVVYKSTWLQYTGATCRPVMDFLGCSETELLIRDEVVDPDMVHGKAVIALFKVTSHHGDLSTLPSVPLHRIFSEDALAQLLLDREGLE